MHTDSIDGKQRLTGAFLCPKMYYWYFIIQMLNVTALHKADKMRYNCINPFQEATYKGLFRKVCQFYEPTSVTTGRCLRADSSLAEEQLLEYCFSKFKTCPHYSTKTKICPYSRHAGSLGYWCDRSCSPGLYGQGTRTQVSEKYYEERCADKFKRCPAYHNKPLV